MIKKLNKGKLFYSLLAFIMAVMLIVPAVLQSPAEAASKRTPTRPVLVKATATKNTATITWKKSKYATSYRVSYKESGAKRWSKLAIVSGKKTSYTHKATSSRPLKAGKKYIFTVRAYNSYAKKWSSYDAKGKTVTIPATPSVVKTIKVKANNYKQTTVTWSKSGNATNYLIYYRPGSSKKWTRIAMVDSRAMKYVHKSSSKYPLKAGNTYYYTVRGYNKVFKTYGGYNKAGVKAVIPSKPQPTETPTETPEPTIEPTATPKPTQKPKPTATSKPTQTPKPTATPTPVPNYMTEAYARKCEKEMIRLANVERKKAGLPALVENEALNRAARVRVEEIVEKFSHGRPNGEDSSTVGYEVGAGNIGSEVIERGGNTPEIAISAWMQSKGHRNTILSSSWYYVGAGWRHGVSQNSGYAVLVFADKDPDQKYTLSVDANGGTFPTKGDVETFDLQVPAGATVPVSDIPVPVKEENEFKNWTLIDTVGIETRVKNCVHMFEDLKVKANWTPLATPIPTLTPTPTLTPEPIITPDPDPVITPEVTITPEPTETPEPTTTPEEDFSDASQQDANLALNEADTFSDTFDSTEVK